MARGVRRESTLRAIGITIVMVIGIAFVAGLWAGHTYGTLDPLAPPPKMNVFGRDFRISAQPTIGRVQADATRGGQPVDILEAAIGAWPFVPPWVGSAGGSRTPTVVWLRVGPDAYQAYELSGGP